MRWWVWLFIIPALIDISYRIFALKQKEGSGGPALTAGNVATYWSLPGKPLAS